MQQVIARFNCYNAQEAPEPSKCWTGNDPETHQPMYKDVTAVDISMGAVVPNTNEPADPNNVFAASTPTGSIQMRVMNEAIREGGFFQPGHTYEVLFRDITPSKEGDNAGGPTV